MEDPSKLPAEARGFVALPEYVENPDGTFTHQVPVHCSLQYYGSGMFIPDPDYFIPDAGV
jgi:hypothetical protein